MAKKHSNSTILYRSETNKVLGGVCGGLGEVFDVDPTVLRVLFLIALFFGGSGFLLYLILWVVIPSKSKVSRSSNDTIRENIDEMKERAQEFTQDFKFRSGHEHNKMLFGVVLLVFGVMFLMNNFGLGHFFNFAKLWPLILIVLGFFVLLKRNE